MEEERFDEAGSAGQNLLTFVPDYVPGTTVVRINQRVAHALSEVGRYAEALPYLQAALALDQSAYLYFDLARTLYHANPADPGAARAAFEQAMSAAPTREELRIHAIDFWYSEGQGAEAALLCAEPALTEAERTLCVPVGESATSGAAFRRYLDAETSGETEAMARELQEAITLDRGWEEMSFRHRAWYAWGEILRERGDYSGAIAAYQTALAAVDPLVDGRALSPVAAILAQLYVEQGQITEAVAAFEQAIEYDPDNVFAYINLARTLYDEEPGDLTRPRALLLQAVEISPDDAEIWEYIIGFWTFVGEREEVAFFCDQAPYDVRTGMIAVCLGDNGIVSGEAFFRFLELHPSDPAAAYAVLESAIRSDIAWSDPEQRFIGWTRWGTHLFDTQRIEEAVEALEFAISIESDLVPARERSDAHQVLAAALNATGESDEALAEAEVATLIDPTNAFAQLLFARLLYDAMPDNPAAAEAAFARARLGAAGNPFVWELEAIHWLQNDEQALLLELCAAAPADVQPALALYCWAEGTPPSATYYAEYTTQNEAGNTEAAFENLRNAVTVDGGWLNSASRYLAWRAWGAHVWQSARYEEAATALRTAITAAPPDLDPTLLADDHMILGLSLLSLGNSAEAVDAFTQSIALNPDNPWARLNLGYALYAADPANKVPVREQFDAALAIAPDPLTIWQRVIEFWRNYHEADEMTAACQQAATTPLAADLAPLCGTP
jgi:tetratricopeptide (TPR) repeat protein